jgi:Zn-dependent protease with chaperone function
MSVAVCLLGYSLAVAVLAPDALRRATHGGSAPRMGIAVWVLAIGSVPAAWIAAVALVGTELTLARGDVATVLAGCVAALRAAVTGEHGIPVQVGLVVLAGLVTAGLVVLATRLGRDLRRARRHTHRHADAARLVGQVDDALGAVVVEVPERLAYAVAGRPHTIVLSRATLDALDDAQLHAVLAHERAHLAGRHHLLLAVARALAVTMPRIRLFTVGSSELSRLVEMRADDAAARGHGTRTVFGALLALAGGPAPPGRALAAADTAVADRAERLMFPPTPGQLRSTRLRLGLAVTGLLSGPALGAMLALARSGLCDGPISL